MPYVSEAQRGYMHAAEERGEIDPEVVEKFDRESKGQKNLPYKKKVQKSAALLVPVALEKGRMNQAKLEAAGQVGMDFDEEAHPRAPKGDTEHHGGEFVKKEEAPTVADQAAEVKAKFPTAEALNTPWTISPDWYQHLLGVKQPMIGEISGLQYSRMSDRQKKAYDAKNAAEWEASAHAKEQWRKQVIEAWDAGSFDPYGAGISPDARNAVTSEKIHRDKQAKEANFQTAHRSNEITSIDQVNVGDRVFDLMSGKYGTVTKKHKTSVVFEQEAGGYNPGPRKVDARGLRWQSYGDLQAASGLVRKCILTVPHEVRSEPMTQTGLADFLGEAPDEILDPESKPPAKPRVHRRYPERRNAQGGRGRVLVPVDPK